MSDTVKVKGELKKLHFSNKATKELWARELVCLKNNSYEGCCTPYDTYLEMLMDDCFYYTESVCFLNGEPYEIINLNVDRDPTFDYCIINSEQLPFSFKFETMFYNGGTCWEEMVEEKITEMEK